MAKKTWARKAVDQLSDEEVKRLCERFGIPVADMEKARPSPIERMIDDACRRTEDTKE